jgi:hypothetical protein
MGTYILGTYSGSRVALLGMAATWNNNNDPQCNWVVTRNSGTEKADTAFVDNIADYNNKISPWFDQLKFANEDDNAQFLKYGITKMAGGENTNLHYGIKTINSIYTGLVEGDINFRAANDRSRVPVIIMVSDFMMTDGYNLFGNKTNYRYWSELMRAQADRFSKLCPNGILMTVRLCHSRAANHNNLDFTTSDYDKLMADNVAPYKYASKGWNTLKVTYNQSYSTFLANFKKAFVQYIPPPAPKGTVVKDIVPEGLDVDSTSITAPGAWDAATRTITWDLSSQTAGDKTLSFTAKVSKVGLFENTANVTMADGKTSPTNTTYHFAAKDASIVEQYVEYGTEDNASPNVLQQEVRVDGFPQGSNYNLHQQDAIDKDGRHWIYVGYKQGDQTHVNSQTSIMPTTAPKPTDPMLANADNTVIIYLYKASKVTADFVFYKVDRDDTPLPGVDFTLYRWDPDIHWNPDISYGHLAWLAGDGDGDGDGWEVYLTATSADRGADTPGTVKFAVLPAGHYMLVETKALAGYQLPHGQWLVDIAADTFQITITAHGSSETTKPPAFKIGAGNMQGEWLLPNYPEMMLPHAGGMGTIAVTIIGITLIGAACIYLLAPRRRKAGDLTGQKKEI